MYKRQLKVFTFLSREEIESLEAEVRESAHLRHAQRVLAREVTAWVHGAEAAQRVVEASQVLFGKTDPKTVRGDILDDVVAELPAAQASLGTPVVDILVSLGLEKGKGSARRTIASGGVYLNNGKVTDAERVLEPGDVLANNTVLLRRGRKNLNVIRLG